MVVSFEGDAKRGNRHAHVLAYIPLAVETTDIPINDDQAFPVGVSVFVEQNSFIVGVRFRKGLGTVSLGRYNVCCANTVRKIYMVKDVRQAEVSWSRFEFVTPPKFKTVKNKNRSVVSNGDRQRRAALKARTAVACCARR